MRTMCFVFVILSLAALTMVFAGDATTKPSTATTTATAGVTANPSWCKAGYVCVERSEMAQATIKLIDLQEENARLRAKAKRVTTHLGCGMGVSGIVDKEFRLQLAPSGFCGIIYGF